MAGQVEGGLVGLELRALIYTLLAPTPQGRVKEISYFQSQILIRLSLPPVTNLRTAPAFGVLLTKLPGAIAGAQLTALTPSPCAGKILCSQLPSLNSRTLTLPSEDAHARRQPLSCGDQETMLTEAVCRAKSATFCH